MQQIATHNQSFAKNPYFFARKFYWPTNKIYTKNVTKYKYVSILWDKWQLLCVYLLEAKNKNKLIFKRYIINNVFGI